MTPQAPNSISMSQINTEINLIPWNGNYWLNHEWVRTMAGKPAVNSQISFSDVRGKSWYVAMSVAGYGDRYRQSTNQTVTKTTTINPRVAVSNGRGPFTYAWSLQSGTQLLQLGNTTSATCTVSYTGKNVDITNYYQCVVTDTFNNSTVTVTGIEATIQIGPIL